MRLTFDNRIHKRIKQKTTENALYSWQENKKIHLTVDIETDKKYLTVDKEASENEMNSWLG